MVRICLVTPFAWSQPHDVNEHVAGVAAGLRELGHEATVLAPSTRAGDLLAGRRVVHGHRPPRDVVAVGPAVPVSRRSQMGVPVGVRASLRLALARRVASISCTASSPDFRRSRISRCARPTRSPSRPSARPSVSDIRRRARSARSCSRGSTPSLRSRSRSVTPRPSGSRVSTRSSRRGSPWSSSVPAPKRNRITVELRPNERAAARGVLARAARASRLGGGARADDAPRRAPCDPTRPSRPGFRAHRPRRRRARGDPRGDARFSFRESTANRGSCSKPRRPAARS